MLSRSNTARKRPSDAQVNKMFEDVLLKLSLPEAAKPGMRAKPVEEQWKFVEMYAASGGAGASKPPTPRR
ncbi:hypothetical protein SO694_0012900 [Aureococcus anophagefferens]|uniref:Formin GTPase-binding domain-containing protein n=1 Tax=Aureococcus anophagefferens TaxID=44056 RepID=A0ABR1G4J7_AURAN